MSKFNMIKSIKFALGFILANGIFFTPSYASVDVNFTGNLIGHPPCDITGNDVVFDDVGITLIDGAEYKKKNFDITLICAEDTGQLYIAYSGMRADSFDPRALQTSVAGLGILLSYAGTVIEPDNNDIPLPPTISENTTITIPLSAVPIKNMDPSFLILEQNFTAAATIEVRYP